MDAPVTVTPKTAIQEAIELLSGQPKLASHLTVSPGGNRLPASRNGDPSEALLISIHPADIVRTTAPTAAEIRIELSLAALPDVAGVELPVLHDPGLFDKAVEPLADIVPMS